LIIEKSKIDFDTRLLLEQYLDLLTLKEIGTMETAKLILEQGMPLESRAREVIYAVYPDSKVDSLFLSYPLEERIKINNKIIVSTRQAAVRFKSRDLIYKLSNFISNTHQKNYEKGNFHRQKTLVDFYKEIKDTTNFLQNAENFCNYSLFSVSLDTLKKRSARERNEMFEQRGKSNGGFSYSPFYLQFGSELNNIAYEFFKHTNDLEKLAKALKWSKRSMEINEALVPDEIHKQNPYFMDTYASLLYRLGKKDEAIETQTKAIEILKSRNENTSNLETTLTKIKNGSL
jgi:tetratricopeptide (TPR) repeat protein